MFVIQMLDTLFLIYNLMLLIRILGSWIPEWQKTKFMLFLVYYTDPYLNIFRRLIPPLGMVDISPMIAFLCLGLLKNLITNLVILLIQ